MTKETIDHRFNKIVKHATRWNPNFKWLDDLTEIAHVINKPHEDYPIRVPITAELITSLCEVYSGMVTAVPVLNEFDIKSLHAHLFRGKGMKKDEIHTGCWRHYNVRVGRHVFPDRFWVPHFMQKILPVTTNTDIKEWYALFESIHPFEDGNGRIGGIVVAAFSFLQNGRYLTPTQ